MLADPVDLRGSVALISGASRGIGRAIAVALAREGCDLALLARTAAALEETATTCRAAGARALALPVDVTDSGALAAAVERCARELGRLDVLVNSAGIYARAPAHEADLAAFQAVLDVNVGATMALTRLALPHILQRPRGAVITIGSVAGRMTFPEGGAYCASKWAVLGYQGAVFQDVRERGVKVCTICPGYTSTDMVAGRGLDMDRMIQPDDVARAVIFVATFPDTACPTEIVIEPQRSPGVEAT